MRATRTGIVVALVAGLLGAQAAVVSADTAVPQVGNGHRTIVSLQWDDGSVHQIALLRMLRRYRMHGTFYLNSERLGTRGFMSWDDVHALARAGNEIAGHTLTHKHLPRLAHWKQVKQVCGDRQNLFDHGFHPSSFAYPYGSLDKRVEKVVEDCGYNTGRGVYGLDSSGCDTAPPCPFAETIPPANPWFTRTTEAPVKDTTFATLKSYVTGAEHHGGGWVQIFFHKVCSGCDQYSTRAKLLGRFMRWLRSVRSHGVIVRTTAQVIHEPVQPPVAPGRG